MYNIIIFPTDLDRANFPSILGTAGSELFVPLMSLLHNHLDNNKKTVHGYYVVNGKI